MVGSASEDGRNQEDGSGEADGPARSEVRKLYLQLPHLLQLEPEFSHVALHVQQAHMDGRGAGRQELAGGRRGFWGTQGLPTRNVGCAYGKEQP